MDGGPADACVAGAVSHTPMSTAIDIQEKDKIAVSPQLSHWLPGRAPPSVLSIPVL